MRCSHPAGSFCFLQWKPVKRPKQTDSWQKIILRMPLLCHTVFTLDCAAGPAKFSHSCNLQSIGFRGCPSPPFAVTTNAEIVVRCPYCVSDYEFRPLTDVSGTSAMVSSKFPRPR